MSVQNGNCYESPKQLEGVKMFLLPLTVIVLLGIILFDISDLKQVWFYSFPLTTDIFHKASANMFYIM